MIQPLDPLEFLNLALELANRDRKVATLRTAVGRAYYTLFLIAREKTGTRGRRKVHKAVINALKRKRNGYRTTGDQLDALFRLRCVADYQLLPDDRANWDWIGNWSRAEKLANQILPKLTGLRR